MTTRETNEPWGLVVNEAMHAGLPVVATDAVGAAAGGLVRDGENGYVVPERDPVASATRCAACSRDPDVAGAHGRQARVDAAEFNYDRMADAFEGAVEYAIAARLDVTPAQRAEPADRSLTCAGSAESWALPTRSPSARRLARDMAASQSHRGPDDDGAWADPAHRVALSHRRLSIIDLSAAGHQPMSNEDGTVWITYNGEVYNHEALRSELEAKGHTYRSRTDTETILHLYEEEGPACVAAAGRHVRVRHLGRAPARLLLARDRLGVKPLLYALLPDGLVFGSEVRAILEHPAVHPELDEDAFYDYLTFAFAPPPRTLFKGIHKLGAAEYMVVERRRPGPSASATGHPGPPRPPPRSAPWARRRW